MPTLMTNAVRREIRTAASQLGKRLMGEPRDLIEVPHFLKFESQAYPRGGVAQRKRTIVNACLDFSTVGVTEWA